MADHHILVVASHNLAFTKVADRSPTSAEVAYHNLAFAEVADHILASTVVANHRLMADLAP